jgi:hypothetical protein
VLKLRYYKRLPLICRAHCDGPRSTLNVKTTLEHSATSFEYLNTIGERGEIFWTRIEKVLLEIVEGWLNSLPGKKKICQVDKEAFTAARATL